ncbi:hypothetical protein UFOVP238_27 [uncultured Caudovirales phage]|uniref:Uncharacterized protein n=1 Tax=uncultured Caudovirales phage TaxID=2100421 RepID=A0A6J7WQK5_9CAUD|nr:hypothetical protein UFOVP238_27 [uncultured Caudovirales phage]
MSEAQTVSALSISNSFPMFFQRKIEDHEITDAHRRQCVEWFCDAHKANNNDLIANHFLMSVYRKWQIAGQISDKQVAGSLNTITARIRKEYKSTPVANGGGMGSPTPNSLTCPDLTNIPNGTYRHPSGITLTIKKARNRPIRWVFYGNKVYAVQQDDGTCRYSLKAGSDLQVVHDALVDIVANPTAALMNYGSATGRCGLCNRELTDALSVWYGVGPICLKQYVGKTYSSSLLTTKQNQAAVASYRSMYVASQTSKVVTTPPSAPSVHVYVQEGEGEGNTNHWSDQSSPVDQPQVVRESNRDAKGNLIITPRRRPRMTVRRATK